MEQKWILIEEKEPSKKELALFCGIHGGIFLGYYVGRAHHVAKDGAVGARPFGEKTGYTRTVTAWLPVPAPYIDEKKTMEFDRIRKEYLRTHIMRGGER